MNLGVQHLLAATMFAQVVEKAAANPAPVRGNPADLFWQLGTITICMLLLALVVWYMRGWYAATKNAGNDQNQLLSEFRDLHEQEELTPEEFKTIKAKLSQGVKDNGKVGKMGGDPAKRPKPTGR